MHPNQYKNENNKRSCDIMFLIILKMVKKLILHKILLFFINTNYDTKQILK